MNIVDQFQKLDDLIVEHTQGQARSLLRNQLALLREQVEAYQASSDKQDDTLAAQLQRISELTQMVAERDHTISEMKQKQTHAYHQKWDELKQQSHKLWNSKNLNYDH